MKRTISKNLALLLIATLMCMAAYYLLLQDNCFNMSISAIIKQSHHLNLNKHLLVLGMLPIYIAMVIFGTAILGLYLSSLIQATLFPPRKRTISIHK